jgi:3',5'-cyclic AMP phosphodiesterase CpdA
MVTRRKALTGAGLMGLSLLGYSYHRGIRLPGLHWDPLTSASKFRIKGVKLSSGTDLIQIPTGPRLDGSFRAYAPQPALNVRCDNPIKLSISISNISVDAVLATQAGKIKVNEVSNGTNRTINIEAPAGSQVLLKWTLPTTNNFTFASIGDTGGDKELHWCIERAHALGAKFLLHLGDFNYQPGDYQRSIDAFNDSPIPVYVSIGNHDFHDDGAIYSRFVNEIGPLNNTFTLGKTRFVNIDTAANVLPYGAGQRGKLFDLILADSTTTIDTVAFTHRPLHDPSEDSHHDIGSEGERDWLIAKLKRINAKTLLSGHIHIYDRSDFDGIDNIIAGQGLGHQDLLINGDASKIVIGHVDKHGSVSYTAEPLAMPMNAHCHPRVDPVKESLRGGEHEPMLKRLEQACKA